MIRGLLILACCVLGCAVGTPRPVCPVSYTDARYQYGGNGTFYPAPNVALLARSSAGVPIGPGVDGARVDAAFDAVSKCLGMKWYACGVRAVMVAPDWAQESASYTGATQAFPCTGPLETGGKWVQATQLCSGVNQWPATIWITPDHHALKWEVERMLIRDTPSKDGGKNCWQAQ